MDICKLVVGSTNNFNIDVLRKLGSKTFRCIVTAPWSVPDDTL